MIAESGFAFSRMRSWTNLVSIVVQFDCLGAFATNIVIYDSYEKANIISFTVDDVSLFRHYLDEILHMSAGWTHQIPRLLGHRRLGVPFHNDSSFLGQSAFGMAGILPNSMRSNKSYLLSSRKCVIESE